MHATSDRVRTRHPQTGKKMPRIDAAKYQLVRRAILRAVPRDSKGIPFKKLSEMVGKLLPSKERRTLGSLSWYTTVVKLDLEARGEIERVPDARPQHLRRGSRSGRQRI